MFAAIARPSDAYQPSHAPGTPPIPAGSARHRRPRSARAVATPIVVSLVAALLLAFAAVVVPSSTLGATSATARCDGAALRTKPSAAATRVARVGAGTKVVAVSLVRGGKWHVRCAGSSASGRSWWKITLINDKRRRRRATTGPTCTPPRRCSRRSRSSSRPPAAAPACGPPRGRPPPPRRGSRTAPASRRRGSSPGDHWSVSCGGSKSGKGWYRITAIDGVSVRSLYGISAVYAARGLLKGATGIVPPPPDTSGYIEGIDVSHYQGTIDWARVAAAGKRFAFMKASDSTDYVDPTYVTNRAQAKLQGLKVGAYHFARPDATPGEPSPRRTTSSRRRMGRRRPRAGAGPRDDRRPQRRQAARRGSRRSSAGSTTGPASRR